MGKNRSVVHLERKLGGRLYESFDSGGKTRIFATGEVMVWQPPERLVLQWRAANFTADEVTHVDVGFAPSESGTLVTVRHHGWSHIRPDHPARHGEDVPRFIRNLGLWWADLLTCLRERADPTPPGE